LWSITRSLNIKDNHSSDTTPAFLYNPPIFTPQLLQSICADISDADLNAIRKARGFSVGETAARNSFACYFVSSIGVQEAMQSLNAEESVLLHLLHQTGEVHTNTSRYNHPDPLSRG